MLEGALSPLTELNWTVNCLPSFATTTRWVSCSAPPSASSSLTNSGEAQDEKKDGLGWHGALRLCLLRTTTPLRHQPTACVIAFAALDAERRDFAVRAKRSRCIIGIICFCRVAADCKMITHAFRPRG